MGFDASSNPLKSLLAQGVIWGPFLCTLSVCKTESTILNLTPLRFSSARTPCLVAVWKAELTESLT